MKKIIIVIFYLVFSYCHSQKEANYSNIENVEIHLFKNYCENKNSYIFYKQKDKEQFYNQYSSTEYIPIIFCKNYINIELCKINEEAFIVEKDIIEFNWNTKTITLTKAGRNKLKELKFNRHGIPFVILINNQPFLAAWFLGIGESEACDRVYCQIRKGSNELKLVFGVGNFRCGSNPFNQQETLDKLKKFKQ